MIQEPYYNVNFNYTDLKTDLARVITAEEHPGTFNLNFCTKTGNKCRNNALACFKDKSEKEIGFGKLNNSVTIDIYSNFF